MLDSEPQYEGEVTVDSDDAAIRYVAIAEHLFDSIWGTAYYLDIHENGVDQFVAYSIGTDEVVSTEYEQWLMANEHWHERIKDATKLADYRAYLPAVVFGELSKDELFLRSSRSVRAICSMLEDDAVRLWAQGETCAAIRRIDLVIRIAQQSMRAPAATGISGLSASNSAERALQMYERMLMSARCGEAERVLIHQSVRALEGDDPAEVLQSIAREAASLHHAMAAWFEVEGGRYELWVLLARYYGTMAAIQPIIDALNHALEVTFESDEINKSSDQFKWPPEIDIDEVTAEALSETMGLEYADLKRTFESITGDVELMLEELCSGQPDLNILLALRERSKLDETPLSMILYLETAHTIAKNHARLIEVRDRVSALCEAE
ncbi:MAG: hypothetical protein ACX94C_10205 [Phycisphaerales bacterium]